VRFRLGRPHAAHGSAKANQGAVRIYGSNMQFNFASVNSAEVACSEFAIVVRHTRKEILRRDTTIEGRPDEGGLDDSFSIADSARRGL
jgi:hypothetical protein